MSINNPNFELFAFTIIRAITAQLPNFYQFHIRGNGKKEMSAWENNARDDGWNKINYHKIGCSGEQYPIIC